MPFKKYPNPLSKIQIETYGAKGSKLKNLDYEKQFDKLSHQRVLKERRDPNMSYLAKAYANNAKMDDFDTDDFLSSSTIECQ